MKTKNLFIGLAIATIALSSCKQPNEVKDKRATLWDWAFSIYVSDINENDLLDPSNPNGYKIDDIKLYYRLTDGTLLEGKRENIGTEIWAIMTQYTTMMDICLNFYCVLLTRKNTIYCVLLTRKNTL